MLVIMRKLCNPVFLSCKNVIRGVNVMGKTCRSRILTAKYNNMHLFLRNIIFLSMNPFPHKTYGKRGRVFLHTKKTVSRFISGELIRSVTKQGVNRCLLKGRDPHFSFLSLLSSIPLDLLLLFLHVQRCSGWTGPRLGLWDTWPASCKSLPSLQPSFATKLCNLFRTEDELSR